MSAEKDEDRLVIAGFWRRIIAFSIDTLILFLIGMVIGALFQSSLSGMGAPARLIGFVIALAYFGVFNSHIGDGQTPGKRWLDICVVDARGEPLLLPRSLARYAVLGVPYFLNHVSLSSSAWPVLGAVVTLLVFGGGFAIAYLYVFNRKTRQSLHDLVVGSFVVRVESEGNEANFPPVWRGHWVVISVFALFALGTPIAVWRLGNADFLVGVFSMYETVQAQPHVMNAVVNRDTTFLSGGARTHELSASIRLDEPMTDDADYARNIARIMAERDPNLPQEDVLMVVLSYGYDIGIASGWNKHIYLFRPSEFERAKEVRVVAVPGAATFTVTGAAEKQDRGS